MRRPSRTAIVASLVMGATALWCGSVTSAVAREVDGLGGPSVGDVSRSGLVPRPSPGTVSEPRHRDRGRPFDTPPGHEARPARVVAPGRARFEPPAPAPTPTGAVLGATPPGGGGRVVAPANPGPIAAVPAANAGALGGAPAGGTTQPVFSRGQVRSAGLSSALLAIGAAEMTDAGDAEIAASSGRDPWVNALVLLIVGTQILAAAACIPIARRFLGGFGTSRLR